MRFPMCLVLGTVLAGMISDGLAQSDLPVYTDSLANGFQDWNSAAHSLTNTSPVHWGAYSIYVDVTNSWQGISFYHSELDTTPYHSLSFWIHGGTNGGQRLQVQAKLGTVNPPANLYYRFTVLPDAWQQIAIPLITLGAADKTNLSGVWIQLTPGGTANPFYVDDVQFNPKSALTTTAGPSAPSAPMAAAAGPEPETAGHFAVWGIVGALVVIIGLLGWLVAMLRTSGLGKSTALMRIPPGTLAPPTGSGAGRAATDDWKQRVIASGNVSSELAEFAKEALVQGLYTQRTALIETQRQAQADLTELESRLGKLQLPLSERIQAYERRIAELEKELGSRGEEMRELTQATLLLIRQKLDEEKGRERPTRFN